MKHRDPFPPAGITLAITHELLDRHNQEQAERIELETSITSTLIAGVTLGGDERRLRGIPVVGARGVGGVIPGTRPGANLK